MSGRGFTLVEALIAMALLGIILSGVAAGFVSLSTINTHNELRTGAVQAAQIVMEAWRGVSPVDMPDPLRIVRENVVVGEREFRVHTRFCGIAELCSEDVRHIVVEVNFQGNRIYSVETVYSRVY
ncbi:MAG: prepilin-type N-terminal cleavage/methylation domain-containing protein [bacterium]|nr:prepilin-type N-terminal cleavage/methylation domain-containing protein [bacterium]